MAERPDSLPAAAAPAPGRPPAARAARAAVVASCAAIAVGLLLAGMALLRPSPPPADADGVVRTAITLPGQSPVVQGTPVTAVDTVATQARAGQPEPAVAQAAAPTLASPAAATAPATAPVADPSPAPPPGPTPAQLRQAAPEARLIGAYRLLAEGRMDDALTVARELARDEPGFRLAHLLHGDLLAARGGLVRGFGGAAGTSDGAEAAQVGGLLQEAQLRLAALAERPPADALPRELLAVPASVPYVIAVDTSRARLYLFRNEGGERLRLVSDLYTSIGRRGTDKRVEGDQRTPLGVYFTTGRIDPRLLEDRFGSGALPLNYPNALDRLQGRTGSGILLHGVSSDTYSRPPLDSDGCIALANDDLVALIDRLPLRDTPVVVSRSLTWVAAAEVAAARDAFQAHWRLWQQARERGDRAALAALYAPSAEGAASSSQALPQVRLDQFSAYTWREGGETVVVTYRESRAGRGDAARDRWMRQYWQRIDGRWQILIESPVRAA